ncbi:hypothetical protein PINS_up013061 [Pythium insidiosum]|nr:hypothetical protein PINS_up013061 [Pythium insidiosum]
MRRPLSLLLTLTLTLAVGACCVSAQEEDASSVVDRQGLAFASADAFCAVHCKPWRRQRALSECSAARCPSFHDSAARRLAADATKEVEKIDVLSCAATWRANDSSTTTRFAIDADASDQQNVFRGFHEAFFSAFDAMVRAENATYDACQLQLLQTDLLPTADSQSAATTTSETLRKPTLVQVRRDLADQRGCVAQIQALARVEGRQRRRRQRCDADDAVPQPPRRPHGDRDARARGRDGRGPSERARLRRERTRAAARSSSSCRSRAVRRS